MPALWQSILLGPNQRILGSAPACLARMRYDLAQDVTRQATSE
jgi:hypothetical protein